MKNSTVFKSRFLAGAAGLVLIATITNSCTKMAMDNTGGTKGGGTGPGANEVWMQNTAFNPSTITVSAGTTVTWTNKDGMNHNVTSTGTSTFSSSGTLGSGATYSFTFNTAGTYNYSCTFHSGMNGIVVVN